MVIYGKGSIKSLSDALLVIEGCRQGLLSTVDKRLEDLERNAIRSGSCFVFCEQDSDIKRWTDNRKWSPSRVKDRFLMYRELEFSKAPAIHSNKAEKRGPKKLSKDDYWVKGSGGLIKKTLTALFDTDRVYHLISYYSNENIDNLPLPSNDPALQSIDVDVDSFVPIKMKLAQQPSSSTNASKKKRPAPQTQLPSQSPFMKQRNAQSSDKAAFVARQGLPMHYEDSITTTTDTHRQLQYLPTPFTTAIAHDMLNYSNFDHTNIENQGQMYDYQHLLFANQLNGVPLTQPLLTQSRRRDSDDGSFYRTLLAKSPQASSSITTFLHSLDDDFNLSG